MLYLIICLFLVKGDNDTINFFCLHIVYHVFGQVDLVKNTLSLHKTSLVLMDYHISYPC